MHRKRSVAAHCLSASKLVWEQDPQALLAQRSNPLFVSRIHVWNEQNWIFSTRCGHDMFNGLLRSVSFTTLESSLFWSLWPYSTLFHPQIENQITKRYTGTAVLSDYKIIIIKPTGFSLAKITSNFYIIDNYYGKRIARQTYWTYMTLILPRKSGGMILYSSNELVFCNPKVINCFII